MSKIHVSPLIRREFQIIMGNHQVDGIYDDDYFYPVDSASANFAKGIAKDLFQRTTTITIPEDRVVTAIKECFEREIKILHTRKLSLRSGFRYTVSGDFSQVSALDSIMREKING